MCICLIRCLQFRLEKSGIFAVWRLVTLYCHLVISVIYIMTAACHLPPSLIVNSFWYQLTCFLTATWTWLCFTINGYYCHYGHYTGQPALAGTPS